MKNAKNVIPSVVLLLLLGLIWGSGYTIAKLAMQKGVPPLGYSFWQSLGPALVLLVIGFFKKEHLQFNRQHLVYYFVCGLIGIAIPNSNMYFTASHLPAGILAVIVNTAPILTYPIALLAKEERFDRTRLFAILLGVCGIFFIVLPHTSLPQTQMIPWALISLLSPLMFALCAVYIAHNRPADSTSLQLSIGMLCTSAMMLTPIVFSTGSFYALWPPFTFPDVLILLEIVLSSIGYVILFKLLKIAGPVYYSLVGGVVALTGIFWGHVIFAEHLNRWNIIATALILTAIALLTYKQQTRSKPDAV